MAFKRENLSSVYFGNGFSIHHYRTVEDDNSDVTASGYFSEVANMVRRGDLVIANLEYGAGGEAMRMYRVATNDGTVVTTNDGLVVVSGGGT